MILCIDDWKFDIDMERTMAYSAAEAAEHCTCAYCRNFYEAVDGAYPGLREFLTQFGVDIEAPEEMVPVFFDDGSILYDPRYKIYGNIFGSGSLEMAAGLCNLVAEAGEDGCFFLDCYELILPWILNEPLDAVVSPANEPSVLGKAIQKILRRAPKSNIPN